MAHTPMYKLQLSVVPTNEFGQPLLPVLPPADLFHWQMPWFPPVTSNLNFMPFYNVPFHASAGPGYQETAEHFQHHQVRAPSSGPSRHQRTIGFRKAEPLYCNILKHEFSETIAEDRSTGTDPGDAWIGTINPGVGKV
jgi:hypothetical protein